MDNAFYKSSHDEVCAKPDCPEAVRQIDTEKWVITMWHPGFNTTPNNGSGYASESLARAVVKRFSEPWIALQQRRLQQ